MEHTYQDLPLLRGIDDLPKIVENVEALGLVDISIPRMIFLRTEIRRITDLLNDRHSGYDREERSELSSMLEDYKNELSELELYLYPNINGVQAVTRGRSSEPQGATVKSLTLSTFIVGMLVRVTMSKKSGTKQTFNFTDANNAKFTIIIDADSMSITVYDSMNKVVPKELYS
jgi:hypothetical protein